MKLDLSKLIKLYGGLWIALDDKQEKIVAKGENAKTVFEKAKKQGTKIPYLFKVPTRLVAYIG
jgi:hypothetical protein